MTKVYKEHKGLDLVQLANEVRTFWEEDKIFEQSISSREDAPSYVFFEGPPSANGLPGVHHVLARAIKDIFPRYKTMKGFRVNRKAGWDTHGLPIELSVEKELGITKEDIGKKITVEQYNEACKKAVMRYTDVWNNLTQKMGYWVNMDDPYITYKPKYMESVWWLLKQIYDKSLLYKGYTIQPYSPKAGTGLSSHELNQPGTYKDVTDTTVVAQFFLKEAKEQDINIGFQHVENREIALLAWTTTPWTLPSNTALTVGNKIDYVLIHTINQYTFKPISVILAAPLVNKQFTGKYKETSHLADVENYTKDQKHLPYFQANRFKGKDLVGLKYHQLLPYAQPAENPENAFRVISGDFVTTEDGTGIVHTAPTFGADDAKVALQANPPVPPLLVKDEEDKLVPLVNLQGKFRKEMGVYAGKYVKNEYYIHSEPPKKSVDVELAIQLKEENKAFKVEKYKHNYPHCWRTDKPILYYPLDSWFIKVTQVKERMVALNNTINWKPKSTGTGRFGNWLSNANDWNLSRSRFWGIPLPIWRTEDRKEEVCIGSVAELKSEMKKSVEAGFMTKDLFEEFEVENYSEENYDTIDLHKHIVDQIVLVSPSGQPMTREPDLIDVWFDSGSMPYAQWHYPFENKDKIDGESKNTSEFPAHFIAEGVDQTRGWFYTLHAIATMVFDSVAYKNVISNGLVLDKNGQKMSKRLGNAVDPFKTLEKYGPDATRWYMISNANPWDNLKFDLNGVEEVKNKFFGTLYNTYSFFALYANIDSFNNSKPQIAFEKRPELDRWILSELHSLIQDVDHYYADYEPSKAARAIAHFTQEYLSNWYVRLGRRRFWKGEIGLDKISAYQTLYSCLIGISKLSAPIAPFFMDKLYKDLTENTSQPSKLSIHLEEFPTANPSNINKSLERKMKAAQTISSLVLSLRAQEKLKVRQPLQKIMIPVSSEQQKEDLKAVAQLIAQEVNVKEVELLEDSSDILIKQIKPNFKVLGPRFGKEMKAITQAIQALDASSIKKIEKEGQITFQINEKLITLDDSEVEITSKDIEGWLVANTDAFTVALDVSLNAELIQEGIAREIINRIQNYRKESGLEVTDRIEILLKNNQNLDSAILTNKDYIMHETLANQLTLVSEIEKGLEINFDNIETKLFIRKT